MVWRGFSRVRSTRVNGMGLGRIPWHEALRWAEHEGLDAEESESFIDLIEALDVEEARLVEAQRTKTDGTDGKT